VVITPPTPPLGRTGTTTGSSSRTRVGGRTSPSLAVALLTLPDCLACVVSAAVAGWSPVAPNVFVHQQPSPDGRPGWRPRSPTEEPRLFSCRPYNFPWVKFSSPFARTISDQAGRLWCLRGATFGARGGPLPGRSPVPSHTFCRSTFLSFSFFPGKQKREIYSWEQRATVRGRVVGWTLPLDLLAVALRRN